MNNRSILSLSICLLALSACSQDLSISALEPATADSAASAGTAQSSDTPAAPRPIKHGPTSDQSVSPRPAVSADASAAQGPQVAILPTTIDPQPIVSNDPIADVPAPAPPPVVMTSAPVQLAPIAPAPIPASPQPVAAAPALAPVQAVPSREDTLISAGYQFHSAEESITLEFEFGSNLSTSGVGPNSLSCSPYASFLANQQVAYAGMTSHTLSWAIFSGVSYPDCAAKLVPNNGLNAKSAYNPNNKIILRGRALPLGTRTYTPSRSPIEATLYQFDRLDSCEVVHR